MRHRLMRELKDALIVISVLLLIFIVIVSGINLFVVAFASTSIVDFEAITSVSGYNCVMITDSGIWAKKTRDVLLQDRLETAHTIYAAGEANALLISGKSLASDPNDKDGIYAAALNLGFPAEKIITDYDSKSPIDSAITANRDLELNSIILVSQRLPLYRSLYAVKRTGINVIGVKTLPSDIRYGAEVWCNTREFFKRAYDFIAIEVFRVLDK